MKYLLIVLFLVLAGCSNEPEYKYGDCVKFKMSPRYSFLCGKIGQGKIINAYPNSSNTTYLYKILVPCLKAKIKITVFQYKIIGLCNSTK